MDVAYCFGAQSLGLLLCFDSLYPPFRQQFLVELLQMQRRQIIQRDLAELRMFPSPFARLFGIKSASFVTAKDTVNNRGKLSKGETVIRKLSFAPRSRAALSLTIAAQFLRCRRRSSLVTAVRFLNGQEVLSLSGTK